VDVFIEPAEANARATLDALADFGYDVTDLTVQDLLTKKVLIREYVLQADIHPFVAGTSFEDVWSRRVESRIGETPTAFASLDDLIRMKEAAGRPKDLEDLRVLKKLRDLGTR
jgi:hypothetical protein